MSLAAYWGTLPLAVSGVNVLAWLVVGMVACAAAFVLVVSAAVWVSTHLPEKWLRRLHL